MSLIVVLSLAAVPLISETPVLPVYIMNTALSALIFYLTSVVPLALVRWWQSVRKDLFH